MEKAVKLLQNYFSALEEERAAAKAITENKPNADAWERIAYINLVDARHAFTPELIKELRDENESLLELLTQVVSAWTVTREERLPEVIIEKLRRVGVPSWAWGEDETV